jgi:hypothetical protein
MRSNCVIFLQLVFLPTTKADLADGVFAMMRTRARPRIRLGNGRLTRARAALTPAPGARERRLPQRRGACHILASMASSPVRTLRKTGALDQGRRSCGHPATATGYGRRQAARLEPLERGGEGRTPFSRHSPDSVWLWGQGLPLRPSWAMVNRAPRAQQETNQSVDCAEALKRAALPASRRTFAVVVCRI